jgi:hypothetical protein
VQGLEPTAREAVAARACSWANLMSDKSRKSKETTERKAMRLAETTDVSPKQAKDLMKKHGQDSEKVEKAAKNFKAEG